MALTAKIKRMVGNSSPPRTYEVEKGQIRRLAQSIAEDNPIHLDEDVAKSAGFPSLVATPTIPVAFMEIGPLLAEMEVDPQSVMHAEEDQEYFRPICAGDVLTVQHQVVDAYDKPSPGGRLVFLVIETRGGDSRGRDVFKSRRVLVALKS